MAAFDAFLKLDGIDGESVDSKHKGEIDVLSYSWGVSNPGAHAGGGGGGAGKVSFQDFHFVASTSKASPRLFLSCATGQHIKKAVLTVRKSGEQQLEFLKITMEDVLITSFQHGGSSGSDVVPTEEVSFNFAKVEHSYTEQDERGGARSTTTASYDLKKNRGSLDVAPGPPDTPSDALP